MPNHGTARGDVLPRWNRPRTASSFASLLRIVRRAGASMVRTRKGGSAYLRWAGHAFGAAREGFPEGPRRAEHGLDRAETENVARDDGRRVVRDDRVAVDAGQVLAP